MPWDVEFTAEFESWWDGLSEAEKEKVDASVRLLEHYGPSLRFPHCSAVKTSRHPAMRELRVQVQGDPYRVLYAFDPRRSAILLIGGNKTGSDRWYEVFVPIADELFDQHLYILKMEQGNGQEV